MSIIQNLQRIKKTLPENVSMVAISKTHPIEVVMDAYNAGQKIFGENKVQEMVTKYEQMPKDIEWHLVGHLQTNKVKYIAPFVTLIHSVDSLKLLKEIDKEAKKNSRVIDTLMQIHIADEETKFGLSKDDLFSILDSDQFPTFTNVRIVGLMGMATFTDDLKQVRKEFKGLSELFNEVKRKYFPESSFFKTLSMGMSSDYQIAIEEGSTMIRVGSIIFGERFYGTN